MIVNIEKIKTEALLIFCRDLIVSYQNAELVVDVEYEIINKMKLQTELILVEIRKVTKQPAFYIQNKNHFKVKAILNAHNFLVNFCNTRFKNDDVFNPFVLVLSILTYWFGELEKEKNTKEYIFFSIYPFCEIYDDFFIKTKNSSYKIINLKTIEIAEELTKAYDKYIMRF